MRIRPAIPADHLTFQALFAHLGVEEAPWGEGRFIAEMMKTTLVAESDGAVGYAFFRLIGETAHVGQLVTAPEARRQGVGRALMDAVAERARSSGCKTWRLNVHVNNLQAIKLYERMGMSSVYHSCSLRIDWAVVGAASTNGRLIDAASDVRVEAAVRLLPGQLAAARATGRVLVMLENEGEIRGAAVFDPFFPGAHPFRVESPNFALALLSAIRPYARPADTFVSVMIEDQPAVAQALLDMGAVVRREMMHMAGPL